MQQQLEELSGLVLTELGQLSAAIAADCNAGVLHKAMSYSIAKSGKCLRAFSASAAAQIFGIGLKETLPLCVAIEVMHAYSLVHDDLPFMDNTLVRRGQSSCHVEFGEAIAVLTGDALLTLVFELLSSMKTDAKTRCELVLLMAKACGYRGMIAGQVMDIDRNVTKSLEHVKLVHKLKTAMLFSASCEAGAVLGNASSEERANMARFGELIGYLLQVADDMTDVHEDEKNIVHVLGSEGTAQYVDDIMRECEEHLSRLHRDVSVLNRLVVHIKNLCL